MSLPIRIEDSGAEPASEPLGFVQEHKAQARFQRLLPRTLTSRLVVGVVVLLIVLITLLSGGMYFALRSFLYGRLDGQVASATNNLSVPIQESISGNGGLYPTSEKVWVAVVLSDGSELGIQFHATRSTTALAVNSFAVLQLDQDERAAFIARPGRVVSVMDASESLRAESIQLQDGNFAVVALSTREVERTLGRLLLLEVIIGASVVAIAAALTSWGVRVGLRPLRRVTRTAQEVTAELGPDGAGLSRRVPVQGATVEVEEVASSVNTLLYAVETEFAARVSSEERMRQFLADASHELRTPLTSIRGYAELSRLQSASGEAADDSMRRIEIEGNRMSRLVEDLLVLARGDQGAVVRRDPIEVADLMAEAADVVAGAHPDRDIEVEPCGDLIVVGDWDQLLRVLINLTTNAAVHTVDGPIRLQAEAGGSPRGPVVSLRVIDSGPGLAPEEAQHVFERFWRADKARSRAKGGSGLGMAIVAQIAHIHGGYVQFDSTVERGTAVTVTLPVSLPAAVGPAPLEAARPS